MKLKNIISMCLGVILTCTIFLTPINIKANAAVSVNASAGTVYVGDSVTFTVSASGAGTITVSGAANASLWMENNSESFTVTAGSVGSLTVSASGVLASFDDGNDYNVSDSVTVNVIARPTVNNNNNNNINNNNNNNNNTQKPIENTPVENDPVEETKILSSDSSLKSLSVSEGSLSPTFQAGTTSYKVSLAAGTSSIKVNASANDASASVSGTGEKKLKSGNNTISIVVTAEDGSTTTYKIEVYVDEKPLTTTKFNGEELNVPASSEGAAKLSKAFSETKIKMNDVEIPAWKAESLGITLVYLEKDGKANYYIYDEQTQQVTSIYEPISVLGQNLIKVDVPSKLQSRTGMKFQEVEVDGIKFTGWVFEDKKYENYVLIYVMSEGGNYQYYLYEKTQNTLQLYMNTALISQEEYEAYVKKMEKRQNTNMMIIFGLGGLSVVLAGLCVFVFTRKKITSYKKFDKISTDHRPLTKGEHMEVDGLKDVYQDEEENS